MKSHFPRTLRPGGDGSESPRKASPPTSGAPRPKSRPAQTQFAMRALSLAERFAQVCGVHELAGDATTYRLALSAPDGPSTGGGKQAVQHVKLVPESGTTIVIGQANPVEGRAELRSYDCLAQIHSRRFHGQPLPFAREAYDAIVERVRNFFSAFQLQVTLVEQAPRVDAPAAPLLSGRRTETAARVITAVAGLALAVVLFLILRR